MKTKMLCAIAVLVSLSTAAGWVEPHYVQTYSDDEIREQLESLTGNSRAAVILPSRVDHSHSIHMRPVFNQGMSGSCGSASRIGYMFTYETNAYRNLNGSLPENMYPSFFTWLLTDQNSSKEGMAQFNGIPNSVVYGGNQASHIFHENKIWNLGWPTDANGVNYGWMQGFDRWKSAAGNRLERTADVPLNSLEKIEYIKRWIYDHLGDSSYSEGGVLGGGVASSGWTVSTIPTGAYRAGEKIITEFGPQVDHGVTWAGYDDSISYDLNGNGSISNDEKGAIIMLNSWGDWGTQGCAYIPYKLLIDSGRWAEFYYVRKEYRPTDMMKITMNYSQRNNLKLSIGIAESADAAIPTQITGAEHFKFAGISGIPMLGVWQDGILHEESMEFGLDLSDLRFGIDTRNRFRYFLVVETDTDASGTGIVEQCQAIRYNYTTDGIDSPYDSTVVEADAFNGSISGASQKIYIPITMPADSTTQPEFIYIPQKRISVVSVNTENSDAQSSNVLDGDDQTIWHSRWSTGSDPFPHDIQVTIDSTYSLSALEYLPRQDESANGRIANYEIYVSDSPDDLGTCVSSGSWDNNSLSKRVFFEPIKGTFVTLRSLSAAAGDNNTCMAELNLMANIESDIVSSKAIVKSSSPKPSIALTGKSLQIGSVKGPVSLQLFSLNGKMLFSQEMIATGSAEFTMSSTLANGVYIARITMANIEINRQIMVK